MASAKNQISNTFKNTLKQLTTIKKIAGGYFSRTKKYKKNKFSKKNRYNRPRRKTNRVMSALLPSILNK